MGYERRDLNGGPPGRKDHNVDFVVPMTTGGMTESTGLVLRSTASDEMTEGGLDHGR